VVALHVPAGVTAQAAAAAVHCDVYPTEDT
jgi:hypothetical protein